MAHEHHKNQAYELRFDTWPDGLREWRFSAKCGKCERQESTRNEPFGASLHIIRKFSRLGWLVAENGNAKQNRCPDCKIGAHRNHQLPKGEVLTVANNVKPSDARQANPVEFRKICALLESHFVDGKYLNSYSDDRIAKDVNVPRLTVVRVREEAGFGKLREDPEIAALKSDLESVRSLVMDIESKLAAAERRRLAS